MQQWLVDLTHPDPEPRSDIVRIREWAYAELRCIEAAATDPQIPQGTTIPAVYSEAKAGPSSSALGLETMMG